MQLKFCYLTTLLISLLLSACNGSDSAQETAVTSSTSATTTTSTTDTSTSATTATSAASTTVKDGSVVNTAALVALGESLYRDTNLSANGTQACVSCHEPTTGFDDPNGTDTSLGDNGSSIGSRNAPTASYTAQIPDSQVVLRRGGGAARPVIIGGQFLDGRAESLEEQAKAPFLNPDEMNNASKSDVIDTVKLASYAGDFEALFGIGILDDVDTSYNYIADAIAAFERSELFSPFTSIFDQVQNGSATFTLAQARGQNLFNGKAQCARCHSTPTGAAQVFSDFEFRNIGVPANAALELARGGAINDLGLGSVTGDASDNGKFRTPNLRNIAMTAPYMHNGVFADLTAVINFIIHVT